MFNRKYDMTNFLEYSHCSDNNLDQNESDSKHVFSGWSDAMLLCVLFGFITSICMTGQVNKCEQNSKYKSLRVYNQACQRDSLSKLVRGGDANWVSQHSF